MRFGLIAATVAVCVAGAAQADSPVKGEYVESRSANVFVGACHHEGELMTAGRNALLAWRVTEGSHDGVSLKGVSAVAVVAADKHLELAGAKRRSVLYVSADATPSQREAITALLRERAATALGVVTAVKTAPVSFESSASAFRVQVEGVALMKIRKQTAELCCKQPYETWGKPFVPVSGQKTGYCLSVEYRDSGLVQAWSATDQNNAFFGQFAL
jgi:hypothetical protein